jgi:hypothetical protein
MTVEIGDGEDSDLLVCARLTSPLMMPDNLIDICSKCGEAIQHRPHVPKRPRKICLQCAKPLIDAADVTMITPETVADLARYFRKKNAN